MLNTQQASGAATQTWVLQALVLAATSTSTCNGVELGTSSSRTLVGLHYFAGWYPGPFSHWLVPTMPLSSRKSWVPHFPGRIPLLGNYTTNQTTIDAELAAADSHGVDFFEVLWSDPLMIGGCSPAVPGNWPTDPNFRPCTDSALALMLNSSAWSSLSGRLHFSISYSTDFDHVGSKANGMFTGSAGLARFESYASTWVRVMQHPQYLKVDGRPVFKILGPYNFLAAQCSHNQTLAQSLIDRFRAMAKEAGLANPLIGGGWVNPNTPFSARPYQGVLYDYTGTYNSAARDPALGPCPADVVQPYSQLSDWMGGRQWCNHSADPQPYVPNLIASFDPRPAREQSCSFAQPSARQWVSTLASAKDRVEAGPNLGFPSPSAPGGVLPALTIYAWNEFAEGGIVAPTQGEGWMKLQAIKEVFGRQQA